MRCASRWPAFVPLLLLAPAWAVAQNRPRQRPQLPPLPEQWWTGKIEHPLHCRASKYPAILGYDFRYWTGVDFTIDLKDFLPLTTGRRLYVLFRVTPQGRPALYFMQRQFIPPALNLPPDTKLKDIQITVGGGVHLGEGKYQVDALAADQDGRACRASWSTEAKKIAEPLRQEPLTVEAPPPPKPQVAGEARQRVAIVANADVFGPRRYGAKLNSRDRALLADSLLSLVSTWDSADFSLHLLDIERRTVLLKESRLEPASFPRIEEALRKVDMTTVDLESLKRGARGDFLAQFIERSMPQWSANEAVIFIGPAWRWFDRLPDSARRKFSDLPKLFHVAITPHRLPPANLLKQFVSSQDGQILQVHEPRDLARAIKRIREDRQR